MIKALKSLVIMSVLGLAMPAAAFAEHCGIDLSDPVLDQSRLGDTGNPAVSSEDFELQLDSATRQIFQSFDEDGQKLALQLAADDYRYDKNDAVFAVRELEDSGANPADYLESEDDSEDDSINIEEFTVEEDSSEEEE